MSIYSLVYSTNDVSALNETPALTNVFSNGISSQVIRSGETSYNASMVDGYLQSSNFVTGSVGWQIKADGTAEFDSGYFRGDISAATGSFGGTVDWDNVNAGTNSNALNIGNAKVKIDGANERILINDGTNDRVLIGKGTGLF